MNYVTLLMDLFHMNYAALSMDLFHMKYAARCRALGAGGDARGDGARRRAARRGDGARGTRSKARTWRPRPRRGS
jgi:hypothetical protein